MSLVRNLLEKLRGNGFNLNDVPVEEIQTLIDKADAAYYRPGMSQIMTDAEYDLLLLRLEDRNPGDPRLTRVGPQYDEDSLRDKIPHLIPMGSLENTDDGILGFEPWRHLTCSKLGITTAPIMASLKVDGASICLTYEDGKLVRAVTRGNGEVGEDITANAVNFRGVPTILSLPVDLSVRGEAVLFKDEFEKICDRDGRVGDDRSNARNVGNGILGRLDGQDSDKITFIAFNAYNFTEGALPWPSEENKFACLAGFGFTVVPHRLCHTVADFQAYYDEIAEARDSLEIEIDGMVVVFNSYDHQQHFVTSDPKSLLLPKFARAVKFPAKSNTTKLNGVTITNGHTGAIIPTAILETVRVGGVNVSNALLNNWDEIARLGVQINDIVEVILAGDIIPKIIRVVKKAEDRIPIAEPDHCPCCNSETTRMLRGKPGAVTYCSNPKCSAAVFAKLDCWIGNAKKGVGIMDIGDNILKAAWDAGLLADPSDLYKLKAADLKDLKLDSGVRVGQSRADKIVANIAEKRKMSLSTFLGSLGIELLGRRRVTKLCEDAGGRLAKLENWLDTDLMSTIEVPGLGDAVREAIINGLAENRELIERLIANGVEIEDEATKVAAIVGDASKPFAGMSFCWTGCRDHIAEVEAMGGVQKSGISKGLTFLVQKDATSTSNKTKKADEYGVKVISIDYLRRAIAGEVTLS